ncbi:MAG: peptidoglycan-binding domain-containing protein [Candidatus Binatia bacterium]
MSPLLVKNVLAGAVILILASPGWAAEEKKAAPAKEEKAEKVPAKGSEDVKKVQEALKAKGQDPGPIDGVMGPKTRAAIKAFQEASGVKGSGRLDDETAQKLGIERAKKPEVKKEEAKGKKETK